MRLVILLCILVGMAAPALGGMRDDLRLVTGARAQLMPVVEEALAAGADIDARDAVGRTALMWSAFHGNASMLHYLLERGAGVNVRDRRGRTALMWGAIAGHGHVASALLASGADPALRDSAGKDAAAHAGENGHPALVDTLAAEQ